MFSLCTYARFRVNTAVFASKHRGVHRETPRCLFRAYTSSNKTRAKNSYI